MALHSFSDTPLIKKIKLPSGNEYFIADRNAREIIGTDYDSNNTVRERLDVLEQAIAGGVSFIIAWDGASTPVPANIPAGVQITYQGTTYTGTLSADSATPGAFYLIHSDTQLNSDVYDEYVPVGSTGSKSWEKIGDTQVDLSDVVVAITTNTSEVLGSGTTITVTPTRQYLGATASGANTQWNSKDQVTAVTGVSATKTNVKATASGANTAWNNKDTVTAVTGVTATTTNVKATASGGNVAWNSKDQVTAITGLPSTNTTKSAIGASSTFTVTQPTVTMTASSDDPIDLEGTITNNITTTTKYIKSGSVTGVQSSTTTASKATAATSQTTADGTTTSSSTNTDILKGASVSNEVLTLGACTLDTQTTSQFTFSDVTVPIKATAASSFFNALSATGVSGDPSVVTDASPVNFMPIFTASGANVAWNNKDSVSAITAFGTPTTDTVIGTDATFTVTQPTVALATGATAGTGVISVATNASASSTDTVIGSDATFTITQPTVALSTNATAGIGVISVATDASASSTDTVIGSDATFNITQPTISVSLSDTAATGKQLVVTDIPTATLNASTVDAVTEVTAVYGDGTTAQPANGQNF